MKAPRQSRPWMLPLLGVIALAVLLGCPFIGMQQIPLSVLTTNAETADNARKIFWDLRVPRVLLAFVVGIALASSGMAFQAMFRNALATPFTLGVAGGASLGAAIFTQLGLSFAIFGLSGISIFAFIGALGSICLVYGLTRLRSGFSAPTMLLAGIAVNFFFTSLILFIQYMSDYTRSFRIVRWLMGGFGIMGYGDLLNVLPLVIIGVLVIYALTHELNLMILGEELAISRGVDAQRVKRLLFVATSICIGGVVAVCGPIGFVGMMAPHICRLLVGGNHRRLLPASCLFGGAFLVLCDTAGRTLIAPTEIPVGVITALLGGPFFLWLLIRSPRGDLGIQ